MALSHYTKLATVRLVLWLDGKALTGPAVRFEAIKKSTPKGDFVWFAPPKANGNWRGFKVSLADFPGGTATRAEISVGLDGPRTVIPEMKVNVKTGSSSGRVPIILDGEPMVFNVTLKLSGDDAMTVTPRVARPGASAVEALSAEDLGIS